MDLNGYQGGFMSEYSVIVRLQGFTRAQIKRQLRTTFGSAVEREAQIIKIGTPPDYHEACRANNHFGCVHWTDEDIEAKLKDLKIPKTLQIVRVAKNSYALRHISDRMIEHGWEVIEQAILEANKGIGKIANELTNSNRRISG